MNFGFFIAISTGNIKEVKRTLEEANLPINESKENIFSMNPTSPGNKDAPYLPSLHLALKYKQREIQRLICEYPGVDINIVYKEKTALHLAIHANDIEMVKYLVNLGADRYLGECLIYTCVLWDRYEICQFLLGCNRPKSFTPIFAEITRTSQISFLILILAYSEIKWKQEDLQILSNNTWFQEYLVKEERNRFSLQIQVKHECVSAYNLYMASLLIQEKKLAFKKDTQQATVRFLRILIRLPKEVAMIVCNRLAGFTKDNILFWQETYLRKKVTQIFIINVNDNP